MAAAEAMELAHWWSLQWSGGSGGNSGAVDGDSSGSLTSGNRGYMLIKAATEHDFLCGTQFHGGGGRQMQLFAG